MKKSSTMKSLELQNQKLAMEINSLKNAQQNSGIALSNSLAAIVQQAALQTNLTSFNPILENNIYAPLSINWTMLTYMYKTHGIIQTAIDMPVLDALRGGLEITSKELDEEDIKALQDDIEEFGIMGIIGEAMIWTRLYGGGGLVINTDQDFATPLQEKKLNFLELYAVNRWELMAPYKIGASTSFNPWEMYAKKSDEFYNFYGKRLHSSRVLTMNGKAAPYIIRWQLAGWGMSEVERMVEDFNMYIKTKNVTYELLEEAKIDVYRLKDLNVQLASNKGTNATRERIQLMNQLKNFNRAIVMDMEDEFQQKQITFSGLSEVMKQNMIGIASALRMPLTKLFGLSASGFNSGEDDIENYNAMVESEVRQPLRHVIRKVLNLLCLAKFGFEPDLAFEYKPLRVMSTVEEENVKTSKFNRIIGLYDRALIDSQEAGEMLAKEKLVSIPTAAEKGLLDEHPQSGSDEGEEKDGGEKKDE